MYRQFNIQQFYVLLTLCIYVFCVDLRTNITYFPIQLSMVAFENVDGLCLLLSRSWTLTYSLDQSHSEIRRALPQGVSSRLLATEPRFEFLTILHAFCDRIICP